LSPSDLTREVSAATIETVSPHTPMLQQYFAAKAEHPGVLLAMRVGDFYEFYGDDAVKAAATLEITLTAREDGPNGKVAMAGVPYHSVEKYLARLLQSGLKVALCDQLEDPKTTKGLIKRGVTRVLTPGTVLEDSMLLAGKNNFLAAICVQDGTAGLAILDSSTGEFAVTEIGPETAQEILLQELARIRPAELLVGPATEPYGQMANLSLGSSVTEMKTLSADRATRKLIEKFQVTNLRGFGCDDKPSAIVAASMILGYAETNKLPLTHVDSLVTYSVDGFMRMDPATRRSLELTQNLSDGSRRLTLLAVLDETVTSMGTRLIRRWIEQPLLDKPTIESRLDAVARLHRHALIRGELRDSMKGLTDIERLVSRCATGLANPRDLFGLRTSLLSLAVIAEPLRQVAVGRLSELREEIVDHGALARQLDRALAPEPPLTLRDGGILKPGFDPELDKLRDLSKNGKEYIAGLERSERQNTGINSLKVGFNSVFGYYLEIAKSQIDKVPENYIRKQTTANAERYITAELKDSESRVLGAEEKAVALEVEIFHRLRMVVVEQSRELLRTARALAEVDVLASLAEVASIRRYVRPELADSNVVEIFAGRHPVVEANSGNFVPNDLAIGSMGEARPRTLILTGPNMAGKSTFLRQNALIAILAQIGSFVPATKAVLGLCDRVFARIGAKDELALGQSTFMVEMIESANILNHATERSLVILDEIGRGTSTFDGLAIAWAMVEHLVGIGAKTLFATHYHQLNALADQLPGIANFRVAVEEIGDNIVWTHRVLEGGTDRSYGIHVARMAGVPNLVLTRATEILQELEQKDSSPKAVPNRAKPVQLTLFELEVPAVVQELKGLDVNQLTPLEALKLLDDWKSRFAKS
jgi:DNA mismatch repair protein MutS